MLKFDDAKKAGIVNNLGIIAGVRTSETSVKVMTSIFDTICENGVENTKLETLTAVKVMVNEKALSLTEKQAVKIMASLSLISDFSQAESETINRKNSTTKPKREKRTIRFSRETSDDKVSEIAKAMAEWRITDDGSRALSWKNCRAELGIEEDEFHKVIRPSLQWKNACIDRIKELKARDEGWEYCGKLEVLTGIKISDSELE